MKKSKVLEQFGGIMKVAEAIGVAHAAVCRWDEELNYTQQDRVTAACWRLGKDPSPLLEANDYLRPAYIRTLRGVSHANA